MPEGSVIEAHTDKQHFYKVQKCCFSALYGGEDGEITYPSVTGMLQFTKDEGLMNWKMGRALDYVFAHYKEINDNTIIDILDTAKKAPVEIFQEAGHVGTAIHNIREAYFTDWVKNNKKPDARPIDYIPEVMSSDLRITSALRALERFIVDYDYWPIACEMFVFDPKLECGGTLDDIGFMRRLKRKGNDPTCPHIHRVIHPHKDKITCMACNQQISKKFYLTLLDVKTSNQFKDHYFFQVGMYYKMFRLLIGLRPEKSIILKLDKENGTYKLEDLRQPAKLASYAGSIIRANQGLDFIKNLRKDNLKKVGKKIEL